MGMIFGYARVSSQEQNLDRQIVELEKAGCDEIFMEKISGKDNNREQLNIMLSKIRSGDTVYVKSLDRLSRNSKAFAEIWEEVEKKGGFIEVKDPHIVLRPDGDPMTLFFVQMMMAVAQLERSTIRSRQREGIELAKKRNAFTGRRPNQQKHDLIKRLWETGQMKAREIAEAANMSYPQTCKIIKELKNATPEII